MAAIFTLFMVLSILEALTNADKIHELKKINPGVDMILWPDPEPNRALHKWSFETCEGCRIVVSCIVLLPSCDDHVLTIDDGETTSTFCGKGVNYGLRTSQANKVSFSIDNAAGKSGSYCRVLVSKPYTNKVYKERDSSEDGLGKGSTRQTSCKCGWANKSPGRIVGGREAGVNEFPFAVLIMKKSSKYTYCGGSIITPYHVLTAAHCTAPLKGIRLSVIVGEHDTRTGKETPFTKIIDVESTIEHPEYVDREKHYDIAIMKLKERIEFNDAVGPVCLPSFTDRNMIDEYVKVMGWGLLKTNGSESPVLLKANLNVIDLDICRTLFASVDKKKNYQLCTWAPNRDSCQGDSGGPLVWQDPETQRLTQVGLVSFGKDCGSKDPAVNSNIAYFMNWIVKTIKETSSENICI